MKGAATVETLVAVWAKEIHLAFLLDGAIEPAMSPTYAHMGKLAPLRKATKI